MKIGIGIQCQDNSTRLPHKSVRPFHGGKSILEILIEKFKHLPFQIFVLTTKDSPKTINQAKKLGATVFLDKPKNLFRSYLGLCIVYKLDAVIRVCADNPFIQLSLLYPLVDWGRTGKYHYVAFEGCMQRHEGFWCEFIMGDALATMTTKELTKEDKEHCTKYIYEHPEEFEVLTLRIPPVMDDMPVRLTVDTMDDFRIAKRVYKVIKEKYWMFIYNFLRRHRSIVDEMKKNILENRK